MNQMGSRLNGDKTKLDQTTIRNDYDTMWIVDKHGIDHYGNRLIG